MTEQTSFNNFELLLLKILDFKNLSVISVQKYLYLLYLKMRNRENLISILWWGRYFEDILPVIPTISHNYWPLDSDEASIKPFKHLIIINNSSEIFIIWIILSNIDSLSFHSSSILTLTLIFFFMKKKLLFFLLFKPNES